MFEEEINRTNSASARRQTVVDAFAAFVNSASKCFLIVFSIGILLVHFVVAQEKEEPDIMTDRDIPYEMQAPWFNDDNSAVEDEVLLRGTLHVVTKVWLSDANHVDRIVINGNAKGIKGTSETTGQRFRLTGAFSFDLRDPDVEINPDGSVDLPQMKYTFQLSLVDPEPAKLTANTESYASFGVYIQNPPPQKRCERIYESDGTATAFVDCGDFSMGNYLVPLPYVYRVLADGGDACVPGSVCVIPDGATLFNGYEGDYKSPLSLDARTYYASGISYLKPISRKWHCKTGDREAPVITGGVYPKCTPFYSSTEPITVYVETTYRLAYYSNYSVQPVEFVVTEAPFAYHMLERPMDQAPVIESFSVEALSGPNNYCVFGAHCEVPEGALLFNGQVGDFFPPLFLQLTASDFEGDPLTVQWYCQSGASFAPISDLGGGLYSCDPIYSYPAPILVYATVSDGTNQVTSAVRTLYMAEFVH